MAKRFEDWGKWGTKEFFAKRERYERELQQHVHDMMNVVTKFYDEDPIVIIASSYDVLENPNGDWKWNGWQKVGHVYELEVYWKEDVEIYANGEYRVNGLTLDSKEFTDRDEANAYFRYLRQ